MVQRRPTASGEVRGGDAVGVSGRPLHQLYPVAVWVGNERRPEAVLALLAGRDGLDPLGRKVIEEALQCRG